MSVLKYIVGLIRFGLWCFLTILMSVLSLVLPRRKYLDLAHGWSNSILFASSTHLEINWEINKEVTEKIHSAIVVSNHQSYLDIPVLYLTFDRLLHYVAKIEFLSVPIWGWALKRGGTIGIDRKKGRTNVQEPIGKQLEKGGFICMMPEGTRSPTGKIMRLHSGPFWMSKKFNVPIIVVGIRDTRKVLRKNSFSIQPGHKVYASVLAVIEPQDDIEVMKSKVRKLFEDYVTPSSS